MVTIARRMYWGCNGIKFPPFSMYNQTSDPNLFKKTIFTKLEGFSNFFSIIKIGGDSIKLFLNNSFVASYRDALQTRYDSLETPLEMVRESSPLE